MFLLITLIISCWKYIISHGYLMYQDFKDKLLNPDTIKIPQPENKNENEIFYGPHLETLQEKRKRQRKQQKKFKIKVMTHFAVQDSKFFMHKVYSSDVCGICYEKENICSAACGHIFHRSCFKQWLETKSKTSDIRNCPICKSDTPGLLK